jgi:hypothetical protein
LKYLYVSVSIKIVPAGRLLVIVDVPSPPKRFEPAAPPPEPPSPPFLSPELPSNSPEPKPPPNAVIEPKTELAPLTPAALSPDC